MTFRVPAEVCVGQPSQTESSPWGPRILGPPSQTGPTRGALCPTSRQPFPGGQTEPSSPSPQHCPPSPPAPLQPRCPHLLPRDQVSAITTLTHLSPGFSMLWEIVLGWHPPSQGTTVTPSLRGPSGPGSGELGKTIEKGTQWLWGPVLSLLSPLLRRQLGPSGGGAAGRKGAAPPAPPFAVLDIFL